MEFNLDIDTKKVLCYYHTLMKEKTDFFKRILKHEYLAESVMRDLSINSINKVNEMTLEEMNKMLEEINEDMLDLF
jgi:hypothetical protein